MPRHDAITWKLPKGYEGLVGNADIEIEVRQNPRPVRAAGVRRRKAASELLGHLMISRGGVEWRSNKRQITRKMTWESFAELMDED